ncbi:MAG TPA: hypothetical protein VMM55_10820 [Thermohalobaculum sp.]|nr:hypothetical protein [Thermohalobaculum sp.]
MASVEDRRVVAVKSDDPAVEVGQLPDERQFIAAVLHVDGGWIAVVHFFAADGGHVDTEHSAICCDGSGTPPEEVTEELRKMLRRLEPYRVDAATVAAFEIEVAGRTLGLSRDREGGGMRLEPGGPTLSAVPDP